MPGDRNCGAVCLLGSYGDQVMRQPIRNILLILLIDGDRIRNLNHLILSTESQLRYVINEFLAYYDHERLHSAPG